LLSPPLPQPGPSLPQPPSKKDCSCIIWRVAPNGTAAPLHALTGHGGPVLYCAWAPDDSKLLTVCEDAAVRLWDTATGSQLQIFG
jgi:WD40 repeat protein